MNKESIRKFILNHTITRELFFIIGQRKVNLRKIDKKLSKSKIRLSNRKIDGCIVSLTSYGERILELKYTLYSLISQTVRPEKIIINFSYEDKKMLNTDLYFFEQYGVEFYFCEDIRSFKKLIPTMQRFPKKTIVTVDDDMYYEKDWLEKLWNKHLEIPNVILAHCIYQIMFSDSVVLPYDKWLHCVVTKKIGYMNFFVGAGGVLYPPNSLFSDFDKAHLFKKLTPIADDIWFYFMALLNGTKISQPDEPNLKFHYVNPYREYGLTIGTTLAQKNVGENLNDKQFLDVMNYYNISEEDFIKRLCE